MPLWYAVYRLPGHDVRVSRRRMKLLPMTGVTHRARCRPPAAVTRSAARRSRLDPDDFAAPRDASAPHARPTVGDVERQPALARVVRLLVGPLLGVEGSDHDRRGL